MRGIKEKSNSIDYGGYLFDEKPDPDVLPLYQVSSILSKEDDMFFNHISSKMKKYKERANNFRRSNPDPVVVTKDNRDSLDAYQQHA